LTSYILHILLLNASQALQLSTDVDTGTPPAADWKQPPGRQRRTWLQQVEQDCRISVGLTQITSQGHSLWTSLRPSAGQAQQCVTAEYITNTRKFKLVNKHISVFL